LPSLEPRLLTVTELTQYVKDTLESMVGRVRVIGEISGFKTAASGHAYFTLKDEKACLNCVMFRSALYRVGFALKDGLQVEATGEVTVYASRGQYQLIVRSLVEAGIGILYRKFEELKKRLAKEGLFDPEHKKPLPYLPRHIGVITSPTGAAIRDIINILTRRFAHVRIYIYPSLVQGKEAATQIANAISRMNEINLAEVLIVGRGGGSLEDLWSFNEETVARAIFNSRIPIISAVGHETDFTIADFVADLRAPTPSAAAEIVTQNHQKLAQDIVAQSSRLNSAMLHDLELKKLHIQKLASSHILHSPLERMRQFQQTLDDLTGQLMKNCKILIDEALSRLQLVGAKLQTLSPKGILSRGYSIVLKPPNMDVVKKAQQVKKADSLEVRLWKGTLQVEVKKILSNENRENTKGEKSDE